MTEFRAALRAGVALYDAGEFHAAHDPWESAWLPLESGTDDERLLHGLIQFTAALHHAHGRNWSGAVGLAGSALGYLADLPAEYRGVDVAAVRTSLGALERDPERVERAPPPVLTHEGEALAYADLDLEAASVAAEVLAEEYGFDEEVIADAVDYAGEEFGTGRSRFAAMLFDFLDGEPTRAFVFDRLEKHVERKRREEEDVAGLFEEREAER
ncbi:DUF309 domain-containing protein [Halorarum halophilum]|uniref:DUF309 domain-containing protein n=1 Tax=Halorarum halophilum TaxID=2743090 RepID=A0A7D5KNH2_9EURY|nr:DUF309 domain-containing protein [Halobaculum halophilum]QLG29295.1 DUF309 domain-containing protein [Halobaculum halophilum]